MGHRDLAPVVAGLAAEAALREVIAGRVVVRDLPEPEEAEPGSMLEILPSNAELDLECMDRSSRNGFSSRPRAPGKPGRYV